MAIVSEKAMLERFAAVGPPPCELYDCSWVEACGEQRLACASFFAYSRTGKCWAPTAQVGACRKTGKPVLLGFSERVEPSAGLYAKTFRRIEDEEAV